METEKPGEGLDYSHRKKAVDRGFGLAIPIKRETVTRYPGRGEETSKKEMEKRGRCRSRSAGELKVFGTTPKPREGYARRDCRRGIAGKPVKKEEGNSHRKRLERKGLPKTVQSRTNNLKRILGHDLPVVCKEPWGRESGKGRERFESACPTTIGGAGSHDEGEKGGSAWRDLQEGRRGESGRLLAGGQRKKRGGTTPGPSRTKKRGDRRLLQPISEGKVPLAPSPRRGMGCKGQGGDKEKKT